MTIRPDFAADSAGVVSLVGWGDPSNIDTGGTSSLPIDLDPVSMA